MEILYTRKASPGGGIGIHTRLRAVALRACGFESRPGHKRNEVECSAQGAEQTALLCLGTRKAERCANDSEHNASPGRKFLAKTSAEREV